MLVKGPLGIVSWVELSFFIMFIALLVWSLSTYLHNSFVTITTTTIAESGLKMTMYVRQKKKEIDKQLICESINYIQFTAGGR